MRRTKVGGAVVRLLIVGILASIFILHATTTFARTTEAGESTHHASRWVVHHDAPVAPDRWHYLYIPLNSDGKSGACPIEDPGNAWTFWSAVEIPSVNLEI